MSSSLTTLPSDILLQITDMLDANEICQLWFLGNHALHSRLANGGVLNMVCEPRWVACAPLRSMRNFWPSLALHLRSLESLVVRLNVLNKEQHFTSRKRHLCNLPSLQSDLLQQLENAVPRLRRLEFEAALRSPGDLLPTRCLLELLLTHPSLTDLRFNQLQLTDVAKVNDLVFEDPPVAPHSTPQMGLQVLNQLVVLELAVLELDPNFVHALPSLTHLTVKKHLLLPRGSNAPKPGDIVTFPEALLTLDLQLEPSRPEAFSGKFGLTFPPRLEHASFVNIVGRLQDALYHLPNTLLSLSIKNETSEPDIPFEEEFVATLPPGLRSLYFEAGSTSLLDVSEGTVAKLPRRLEKFECRQHFFRSVGSFIPSLAALPRTLTSYRGLAGAWITATAWADLPPGLTDLEIETQPPYTSRVLHQPMLDSLTALTFGVDIQDYDIPPFLRELTVTASDLVRTMTLPTMPSSLTYLNFATLGFLFPEHCKAMPPTLKHLELSILKIPACHNPFWTEWLPRKLEVFKMTGHFDDKCSDKLPPNLRSLSLLSHDPDPVTRPASRLLAVMPRTITELDVYLGSLAPNHLASLPPGLEVANIHSEHKLPITLPLSLLDQLPPSLRVLKLLPQVTNMTQVSEQARLKGLFFI